ncbi:MAG: hypothetical protein ACJ73S_23700 [Mycobacteriales bacterium]
MNRRLIIPVLALALLGGGAAGCGGRKHGAQPKATTSGSAQRIQWARCMREHGIDVPDSGNLDRTSKDGADTELQAAMRACQRYRPQMTLQQQQQFMQGLLVWAQCMRDHGVQMDDPQMAPGGNGFSVKYPDGVSKDDPRIKDAESACQSKMPRKPGAKK